MQDGQGPSTRIDPLRRPESSAPEPPSSPVRRLPIASIATGLIILGVVTASLLLFLSQRAAEERRTTVLRERAEGRAEFAATAIRDLGRRQATAGAAALSGEDPSDADLGNVADLLGVAFGLLLDADGALLAVHPSRELDAAALLDSFPHLRQAVVQGETGVSATLDAPTMTSGVAIAVAAPFDTPTGRRVLSTAFDRRATSLDTYLRTGATDAAAAWLVDDIGGVVATGNDLDPPPDIALLPEGEVVELDHDGRSFTAVSLAVDGSPWFLIESAPTDVLYAAVRGWSRWGPWVFLVAFSVGAAGLVRLYSDRVDAEMRLERANADLQAAAQQMSEFVAIAAHEVRTPAAIMTGFADALARRWTEMDDGVRADALHRITRAGKRLSRLVEDLMTQTVAELGEMDITTARIDVRSAIVDAIDASMAPADATAVEVPEGLVALANDVYLSRVIANLLDNAEKYGEVPFVVRAEAAGDHVRIEVRDHGQGVDPAFVPQLFERFSQASGSRHQRVGGIGLGLSVVKAIIEEMDGSLTYEPADPGSRFEVVLPAPPDGPRS